MKVKWAVLCDFASSTSQGKLNLMGIFNQVSAAKFPAIHGAMYLVVKFGVQPSEYGRKQEVVVQLADADGNKMFEVKSELLIKGGQRGPKEVDNVIALNNIAFPKAGDYVFSILVNNTADYSVPLTLSEAPGR